MKNGAGKRAGNRSRRLLIKVDRKRKKQKALDEINKSIAYLESLPKRLGDEQINIRSIERKARALGLSKQDLAETSYHKLKQSTSFGYREISPLELDALAVLLGRR